MSAPGDTNWIERFTENNPLFAGSEYGLHLQDWLGSEMEGDSGCPLVDSPFVFKVEDS